MAMTDDNYNENSKTELLTPRINFIGYLDLQPLGTNPYWQQRFQLPFPLIIPKEVVFLVFDTQDVVVSVHRTINGAITYIQANDPTGGKRLAYECFEVKE